MSSGTFSGWCRASHRGCCVCLPCSRWPWAVYHIPYIVHLWRWNCWFAYPKVVTIPGEIVDIIPFLFSLLYSIYDVNNFKIHALEKLLLGLLVILAFLYSLLTFFNDACISVSDRNHIWNFGVALGQCTASKNFKLDGTDHTARGTHSFIFSFLLFFMIAYFETISCLCWPKSLDTEKEANVNLQPWVDQKNWLFWWLEFVIFHKLPQFTFFIAMPFVFSLQSFLAFSNVHFFGIMTDHF